MHTKKLRGILQALDDFGVTYFKSDALELHLKGAAPEVAQEIQEPAQQEFSMDNYSSTVQQQPAQAFQEYSDEEILHWSANP